MIVRCPNCGEHIPVKVLGRKSLNIPVNNVYDALRDYKTITRAAEHLNCSRGYIYKVLKEQNRKARELAIINKR